MKSQNPSPKYSIPRHLGLAEIKKCRGNRFDLNFGFSAATKRKVSVDSQGLEMLKELRVPKTEAQLARDLGLSSARVRPALRALEAERILVRQKYVPPKMKRYDRHLLFYDLQGADAIQTQKSISNAKVALIGMGGIGSWVSMGLIGAGFKELRLIDFDRIELSNLTRQILYTEKDVGRLKAEVAREHDSL
jgi:hypothetical protein